MNDFGVVSNPEVDGVRFHSQHETVILQIQRWLNVDVQFVPIPTFLQPAFAQVKQLLQLW